MIELPFHVWFCACRSPTMLVNVRKMISIFESKKQPRPLSLPPCVSHDENPVLPDSKPHPSTVSPTPSLVICRPRLHAGETTSVTLRNAGGARRVRDSWPVGKLDYYPRAGCLAVSVETKEPISSNRLPHTSPRNKPRDAGCRTSRTDRKCLSKPTISSTAPPAGQTQRSENNPRSVRIGSSCKSRVSDQKCQNPVWTSSVRTEGGGALTHKPRLRPSDSSLLSLLLFFHR